MSRPYPEVRPWPESPVAPSAGEIAKALAFFPEGRKSRVVAVLDQMKSIGQDQSGNDDISMFGYKKMDLYRRVIPQAQTQALELVGALAPFKQENASWTEALRCAGNSVAEMTFLLTPDQYCGFIDVMAGARELIGKGAIKRSGMEYDLARAAGWALLREEQNPYESLLKIEELRPERLGFRRMKNGKKEEEILLADFFIDFGEEGFEDYNFWVACEAFSLRAETRRTPLYIHALDGSCKNAEPLRKPPQRVIL